MVDNNLSSFIDEDILGLINIHIWFNETKLILWDGLKNFSEDDLGIANQLLKRFFFTPNI